MSLSAPLCEHFSPNNGSHQLLILVAQWLCSGCWGTLDCSVPPPNPPNLSWNLLVVYVASFFHRTQHFTGSVRAPVRTQHNVTRLNSVSCFRTDSDNAIKIIPLISFIFLYIFFLKVYVIRMNKPITYYTV